jgi:hypothetical protein
MTPVFASIQSKVGIFEIIPTCGDIWYLPPYEARIVLAPTDSSKIDFIPFWRADSKLES